MATVIVPRTKHRPPALVDCCVVWFRAIGNYLRVQAQNTHLGGYEIVHII